MRQLQVVHHWHAAEWMKPDFLKEICITLHLKGFSFISLTSHQCTSSLTPDCKFDCSPLGTISTTLRSSTYFHRCWISLAASLTMAKKRIGPNLVPCGTPHVSLSGVEIAPWYRTLWVRPVLKKTTYSCMIDVIKSFAKINSTQVDWCSTLINILMYCIHHVNKIMRNWTTFQVTKLLRINNMSYVINTSLIRRGRKNFINSIIASK